MVVMFRARRRMTRNILLFFAFAGIVISMSVGLLNKPERASAGGGPASCSISAWQSASNPLSWGFKMSINAPNAAPGSVMPGHPGIYSPWTPYIISPGANYFNTYTAAGNKTVYGRYSYVQTGSSTRIEVQCSRVITVSSPPQLCQDPAATNYGWPLPCNYVCTDVNALNYGGPLPCEYCEGECCTDTVCGEDIPGCTNPAAVNYSPIANKDDGSCIIPGCTNRAATNYNPSANRDDGSCIIRGCTDSGASNYNRSANEDDGSCIYPGCTDPAAFNYDPHANRDDGSCKYDECANLPGIQYPIPPGLVKSGGNCYLPEPSCTPGAGINVLTGVGFTVKSTVKNNSTLTLDIVSVSYSGPGGISGTPNGGSPDIVGNGTSDYTGNHTLNYPTSGSVTWTITYDQPYGIGRASVTCAQAITVKNRPPTCSVQSIEPLHPLAGEPFRTKVTINNPNPGNISITQATYTIRNVVGESENSSGSAQGIPATIGANSSTQLASAQNIRIYDTSYDIYSDWHIVPDNDTTLSADCNLQNGGDGETDVVLEPPVCTISGSQTITVGLPFVATVSIRNTNPYAPLDLIDEPYELTVTPGDIHSNADNTQSARRLSGGKFVMTSGETVSFDSINELIVYLAGDSNNIWSFNSEAGFAGGDCGRNDIIGQSAYTQPYARFYGNDVFAGGAYGENCTVAGDGRARGLGYFLPDPTAQNHASYKGTAAELAVFATGQIDGVLPGSQDITRTSLTELSFSNSDLGTGNIALGGQFSEAMCADDYWADMPTDATTLPTSFIGGQTVSNITTLESDTYFYDGNLHLTTTQSGTPDQDNKIAHGRHITIYVDGDTWIGDSSFGAGRLRQIAYADGPWATTKDIPLVRVISKGNIYVDNEVSQLDGMYVAIPTDANPNNTGEIHTCATAEDSKDLMNPRDNAKILSKCGRPLLVNGAFIAKKVNLLRFHGNIAFAPNAPEPYNSGEIAETFRFSPELYLALTTMGGGAANVEFDAITSLPPSL